MMEVKEIDVAERAQAAPELAHARANPCHGDPLDLFAALAEMWDRRIVQRERADRVAAAHEPRPEPALRPVAEHLRDPARGNETDLHPSRRRRSDPAKQAGHPRD